MKAKIMGFAVAVILGVVSSITRAAAEGPPQLPITLKIESQPIDSALLEFSRQTGVQVVLDSRDSKGLVAPQVSGTFTPEAVLRRLLANSGLHYEFLNSRTVAVFSNKPTARATADGTFRLAQEDSAGPTHADDSEQGGDSSLWARFRLAQADTTASAGAAPVAGAHAASGEAGGLEEVVVTAQKKAERLQDVPVPVTVLNGDDLARDNITRMQDYFASVPGLSLLGGGPYGNGGPSVTIRGLSSSGFPGAQTPTVGYVIDDSIFGSSQRLADAGQATGLPDIDPSLIERIEVLKGPQGTLYGADSIGGVIKVVTKDPATDGFSAHVQVIGEDIPDGALGYAVRASANIPISDKLAVRVSAFDRRDPGYIDNVQTGQTNVNSADVYGAHISALFRPTENLSFKLTALLQNDSSNANSTINVDSAMQPTLGDLKQTGLPGAGENLYQVRAFNGTLKAQVAGVNVVSATGYDVQTDEHNDELTAAFGPFANQYFGVGGSENPSHWTDKKFSQEVRLSSSIGHWVDWLVGGFYTHEDNTGFTYIDANNAVTGAHVGSFYIETAGHLGDPPTTLAEEAGLGDLTFHVTNQFDIQVGGRESYYQQAFNHAYFGISTDVFAGAPAPGVPVFQPTRRSTGHDFTWLVTPEYKFTPDLMVYARVATGYQLGGANQSFANYQTPATYAPATTKNYEIGVKGSLDERRFVYDASAYYIDWDAIQVTVNTGPPAFDGYQTNGGRAKSAGLELSLQAHPIQSLRVSAVGSYNHAVLTSSFPANAGSYGPNGAPLPTSMRFSGSLSADLDVAHFGGSTGFVGATAGYIGKRYGDFPPTAQVPRLIFPAYTTVNMRAGIQAERFTVNLYLNNVGNERGIIAGNSYYAAAGGYFAQIIPPRTIGLSVSQEF